MNAIEVMERLRGRYPGPAWAFLEAVRNGTGYSKNPRTADALAMSLYPSRGLHLHGFEVKVSRRDWLREVRDPAKADEIARFCHCWWVVAPVGVVDPAQKGGELPATWGFLEVREKDIRVRKEALLMQPNPPDHLLLAAILRRVCSYATDQAKLEEARKQGYQDGYAVAQRAEEQMEKHRAEQRERVETSLRAFQAASGVRIDAYNGGQIGEAVKLVLRDGISGRFKRLGETAKEIAAEVDKALAEMKP